MAPGYAVDAVRFGFASCSKYEHGYFVAYRDMAAQRFDVILHLGDYIYEHAPDDYNIREPENLRLVRGGETIAVQDYRNRFAIYRTDLDLQAVHASAPFVCDPVTKTFGSGLILGWAYTGYVLTSACLMDQLVTFSAGWPLAWLAMAPVAHLST